MAAYDSDSSMDEDAASFTTTNVLLGYASKEATDDTISQLGGHPSFLDPAHPPSAALARCKVCNEMMSQLLQLHGDLPEHFPNHERRLHIWACRRKPCKRKPGSVRAMRSTRVAAAGTALTNKEKGPQPRPKPEPTQQQQAPKQDLGTSIFGGGKLFGAPPPQPPATNPSSAPGATPQTDLSTTFAAKARLASPTPEDTATPSSSPSAAIHEPWPLELPHPHPSFYLDADYEALDKPAAPPSGTGPRVADLDDPSLSASGGTDLKDDFESTLDKAFQRFADRLAQNPEQVLRYEFKGTPLLYSRHDEISKILAVKAGASNAAGSSALSGIPRCPRCGAQRVFELQLVPHAIVELEAGDEEVGVDGMEWGTIILGVCGRNCAGEAGEAVNVTEWIGVQWEETKK